MPQKILIKPTKKEKAEHQKKRFFQKSKTTIENFSDCSPLLTDTIYIDKSSTSYTNLEEGDATVGLLTSEVIIDSTDYLDYPQSISAKQVSVPTPVTESQFMEHHSASNYPNKDDHLSISSTMGGEGHDYQPSIALSSKIKRCIRFGFYNPICHYICNCPSFADEIKNNFPSTFGKLLIHSQMTFMALPVAVLLFDVIVVLPGYLASKIITEYGVYLSISFFIWVVGRSILRLIAFPGSTSRLLSEIEGEFQKYCIKMLIHSQNVCVDLANIVMNISHQNDDKQKDFNTFDYEDALLTLKKAREYRNRIVAVFHNVLTRLLPTEEDINGFTQPSKYGNNPLVGDIGNLTSVSSDAKEKAVELRQHLEDLLNAIDCLDDVLGQFLNASEKEAKKRTLSQPAMSLAQKLLTVSTDFGAFLQSIIPSEQPSTDDSVRTSLLDEVKNSVKDNLKSLFELMNPSPSNFVFGLDVLRGCLLSRYAGSQQLWIERPKSNGGGLLDAVHIPSDGKLIDLKKISKLAKVVVFCNPNAGLFEAATGLSLLGGNVPDSRRNEVISWTDFYLENGYDIIMFNYNCYGRSYRGQRRATNQKSKSIVSIFQFLYTCFLAPKPSPSSIKEDATAVAHHVIEKIGVRTFILHGESIGGMAAAGAAVELGKKLVEGETISYPTVLICDRTFCNLVAVAQRMVGSWTGSVIPFLTPWWNTDVAADYLHVRCKKVLAQDASDSIIHYSSSLKKGVAITKEINTLTTKNLSRFLETPLVYRMSDHEDVGVLQSSTVKTSRYLNINSLIWPDTTHIELSQAFHFAACARRIGRVATNMRQKLLLNSSQNSIEGDDNHDDEEGVEITAVFSRDQTDKIKESMSSEYSILLSVWDTLARCDGLTGMPLGTTVREGHDCVVDWLTCLLILGPQRVALAAEDRCKNCGLSDNPLLVKPCDFEFHYHGYEDADDDDSIDRLPTLPIPKVLSDLEKFADADCTEEIHHELEYCIKTLRYVVDRLSDKNVVKDALRNAHFQDLGNQSTGRFLNLTCGHNNQYSIEERIQLLSILSEASQSGSSLA